MAQLVDRHEGRTERGGEGTRKRPVVLGTLSVRVDPSAERMAIDSAVEAGVPLVIANILRLRPMPTTLALVGPEGLNLPHEEDLDAVRATARRAAELGVKTELLRVTTRRPVRALLEIVREKNAGLLVFGPDLKLTNRLRFRAVARRLRREAGCLIWVAPDGQSYDVRARERHDPGRLAREARSLDAPGPVVLGTLSSRVEPDAERLAIESAAETGVPLLVVNVVPMPACPRALALAGPEALTFPLEEDYDEVRATAERAAEWGIRVEHLRVTSPRPARALVQVANERGAGLLVLGPKHGRVSRWRLRRAAREVRRNAACLVWIAGT